MPFPANASVKEALLNESPFLLLLEPVLLEVEVAVDAADDPVALAPLEMEAEPATVAKVVGRIDCTDETWAEACAEA